MDIIAYRRAPTRPRRIGRRPTTKTRPDPGELLVIIGGIRKHKGNRPKLRKILGRRAAQVRDSAS